MCEKERAFDENAFLQEFTQHLFSSLRIEKALHSSLLYLKAFFPVDIINAGVADSLRQTLRYLALANSDSGILVDERFGLTPEAIEDSRLYRLGTVQIDNCISSSRVVQESFAHFLSSGLEISKPTLTGEFSTMTIAFGLGKPHVAYFNMIALGRDRYSDIHRYRLKLLEKPLTGAILNLIHHREILSRNENLEKENASLRSRLGHMASTGIIGAETGLKNVMEKVWQVSVTDSPVMITGETGTGKELVAHAIHEASSRAGNPIVCINCGAIPETLADSELFGHEKGSFTGASDRKRGFFEQADGGTIFLDEVAELPLSVQVKLLRVLQEKSFHRVGGQRAISTDVRVIAATHRDISEMAGQGRFRRDLWFRLNVFPIHIPPLRERSDDIPLMADFFARKKAKEMNLSFRPVFATGSLESLQAYSWPGNIRELQNIIERSLITCGGFPLAFQELDSVRSSACKTESQGPECRKFMKIDEMIIGHINEALKLSGGRIEGRGGASDLLGLHPSTLRGKMRKYGIRLP